VLKPNSTELDAEGVAPIATDGEGCGWWATAGCSGAADAEAPEWSPSLLICT
jgi:hypothetical protein